MKITPETKIARKALQFLDGEGWASSKHELYCQGEKLGVTVEYMTGSKVDGGKKVVFTVDKGPDGQPDLRAYSGVWDALEAAGHEVERTDG